MLNVKLLTKYRILGTLSVWPIGCCTAVRDIHCIWSVLKPCLYIHMTGEVPLTASICHLWVSLCLFPPKVNSQIAHKMPDIGYPLSKANWMLCCKETHPLLMKCSKPFYRDVRQMRRLVTSSEGHVLVAPYHFQPRSTLKLLTIYRIFSTLSVQPIVCCTVMKDTRCLQIVSKPSWDL